jgi:SAM-dependent methyltransferase
MTGDAGPAEVVEESPTPAFDQAQIMVEIEQEARRLRREDLVTAKSERELDAIFGRLAPPGAAEDFETALAAAEELAYLNAHAPVASAKPAGTAMKRVVLKAVYFYANHLTTQFTTFATTISRSVRLLGRRVETIEETLPGTSKRAREHFEALDAHDDRAEWGPVLAELFEHASGRVLVGECRAGALLQAIGSRGADAYGVEPRPALVDEAGLRGLEVRESEVVDHLRLVPPGALAGAVLVGCIDRVPLSAQLELLEQVIRVVRPAGIVAVVTDIPSPVADGKDRVVVDLAPGRPLHPSTWEHLLHSNSFEDVRVIEGPTAKVFEPLAGDDSATTALNRNFERLEQLLAGPRVAAVVGRRAAR